MNGNGNASNTCAKPCCGANDSHYCLYDVKPGTLLEDQANSAVAYSRLATAIANYKETGQPFFVGMGL